MTEPLALTTYQDLRGGLCSAAFNEYSLREGLIHTRRRAFPVGELSLQELMVFGAVELADQQNGSAVLLRPEPKMLIYLSVGYGQGEIGVAGVDRVAVDSVAADVISTLRDPGPAESEVAITFWAYSPGAAIRPRRRIHAPAWDEIRGNYAGSTRVVLDELARATEPGPGGLLLWHGQPGTGKSYALRALAREWRDWCDTHFITDADVYLGGETSYLLEGLLYPERGARDNRRWRLIVLEDAGELLAVDARATAGQALSRLLNLTDGLLGAGLKTIVLVTTNEPLRRLHPAVARPGRAWAEVEFAALACDEANEWLEARGVSASVDRDVTLAELFALERGRPLEEQPALGFAA
jgi:uncharacterized protein DUF5925/ATPase family protein associated with various cellular activities (AAA)